jgi:hypothetical protein
MVQMELQALPEMTAPPAQLEMTARLVPQAPELQARPARPEMMAQQELPAPEEELPVPQALRV